MDAPVELSPDDTETERIWRNAPATEDTHPGQDTRLEDGDGDGDRGVTTLFELIQWSCTQYADLPCYGTRPVKGVYTTPDPPDPSTTRTTPDTPSAITPEPTSSTNTPSTSAADADAAATSSQKQLYYDLGDFEYRTYAQVREQGLELGRGLRKTGLRAGDCVVVYAETSYRPYPCVYHSLVTPGIVYFHSFSLVFPRATVVVCFHFVEKLTIQSNMATHGPRYQAPNPPITHGTPCN